MRRTLNVLWLNLSFMNTIPYIFFVFLFWPITCPSNKAMLRRHGAMSGAGGVGRTCVYVPCLDKGGPLSAPQTGDSDGITRGAWVRLPAPLWPHTGFNPSRSGANICMVRESSVWLCVPSRKTWFPVDWRLLVEEHIANIGIPLDVLKYIWFLGICKPAYCI